MASEASARTWLVPIGGLLVATFAICTAELVIAGLLPAIAGDLGVSIPTAGLLITGYAIGVGVAGPILSLLTGRFSRKAVLCGIMAVFVVGNVLCALATSYWTLLGARLFLAAAHGLHFGVAIVVASRLAPSGREATAISVVIAGVSTATILGVPVGTIIGNALGWRATFWVAAVVGVLAFIILAWLIPGTGRQAKTPGNTAAEVRAARRPVALLCYGIMLLLLIAWFIVLSYVVPFLTEVSGVPLDLVPWILMATGVANFAGSLLGGWLGDRNRAAALLGAFALMAVFLVGLWHLAANPWLAVILLCLAWLTAFTVPASLQAWLLHDVRDAPNLASTLMNTASQVGIASGAALGGLVLTAGWGYGQLPLCAAGVSLLALLATAALIALDRRPIRALQPDAIN
jgi:DHA1 family inner membrane transport protein